MNHSSQNELGQEAIIIGDVHEDDNKANVSLVLSPMMMSPASVPEDLSMAMMTGEMINSPDAPLSSMDQLMSPQTQQSTTQANYYHHHQQQQHHHHQILASTDHHHHHQQQQHHHHQMMDLSVNDGTQVKLDDDEVQVQLYDTHPLANGMTGHHTTTLILSPDQQQQHLNHQPLGLTSTSQLNHHHHHLEATLDSNTHQQQQQQQSPVVNLHTNLGVVDHSVEPLVVGTSQPSCVEVILSDTTTATTTTPATTSDIQIVEVTQQQQQQQLPPSTISSTLPLSEPHTSSTSTALVNEIVFEIHHVNEDAGGSVEEGTDSATLQEPSQVESEKVLAEPVDPLKQELDSTMETRTRKSLRISQLRSSTSSAPRSTRKRAVDQVPLNKVANDTEATDLEDLLTEEEFEEEEEEENSESTAARSKQRKRLKPDDQDFVIDDEFAEVEDDVEIDDEDDDDYEEFRPIKKRRVTRRKTKKAAPVKKLSKSKAEVARLHGIIYKLRLHHSMLKNYNEVLININTCLGDRFYNQLTGEARRGVTLSALVDEVRSKATPENGSFVLELSDLVKQYDQVRADKIDVESKIDEEVEPSVMNKSIGWIVRNRRNFSMLPVIGEETKNGPIDEGSTVPKVVKKRVGRPPKYNKTNGTATASGTRRKKMKVENGTEEEGGETRSNEYQRCQYPNCTYESKRLWALQEHVNLTHTGLKQFGCKVDGCPATFFGSSELDNHMKKCHAKEASKEFMPCTWPGCNALFKSKLGLRAHIAVHKGENLIQCDWPGCNYLAKNKRQHENHTRKHTGDRPFSCDYPECGSKFRTNDSLRHHKKSHSEYRPFRCDWPGCEATFKTNRGLTIHRALHTGEKLFKCDYDNCNYASERKYHVDLHIYEQHTHQKPFQCTWQGCDASFLRNDKLQNHLKIHRQEKPYKCAHPTCDKHFVEKGNMMKHYNNVHKR